MRSGSIALVKAIIEKWRRVRNPKRVSGAVIRSR